MCPVRSPSRRGGSKHAACQALLLRWLAETLLVLSRVVLFRSPRSLACHLPLPGPGKRRRSHRA
jgi:hypothetical protein